MESYDHARDVWMSVMHKLMDQGYAVEDAAVQAAEAVAAYRKLFDVEVSGEA